MKAKAIVRPMPEGVYEIISGHRRKYAAQMLGFRKVPVVIRVMSDDEAIIKMVDSNLQRQQICHSEKALAIKMKYEAMKRIPGSKKSAPLKALMIKFIPFLSLTGPVRVFVILPAVQLLPSVRTGHRCRPPSRRRGRQSSTMSDCRQVPCRRLQTGSE